MQRASLEQNLTYPTAKRARRGSSHLPSPYSGSGLRGAVRSSRVHSVVRSGLLLLNVMINGGYFNDKKTMMLITIIITDFKDSGTGKDR